ncbi:hypothetical protein QVD17_07049 [Tagetes erecta]|uniref:Uncharacterized protein n=1 Tax=Tagetes erecta TaxID=13708 RepID=A0AAD8LH30_TARER|nr:hypothetical protein QVD17_07049 [Tagetes erecta]
MAKSSPAFTGVAVCLLRLLHLRVPPIVPSAVSYKCFSHYFKIYASYEHSFMLLERYCKEFSQYLTYKIEGSILQLKRKANSIEEVELVHKILNNGSDFLDNSSEIHFKKLTFNEDSKLRPWRTPSLEKHHLSRQTVHMLEWLMVSCSLSA